ncbi:MAG: hypothetical protein FWD31_05930 [Planctomycetaceae bacterium]|nr:hypothetical protein [Planctomycetaceae bacterium]
MSDFTVRRTYVITIALFMLAFYGCGENSRLKGKVTFSDGQPVTAGTVNFSTPTYQARGEIKPDGTYTVSSLGKNDGLPRGEYAVSLTGVMKFKTNANSAMPVPVILCDEKYSLPETSELKCTVPAPGNRFDIVLDPHPTNYP